MAFAMVWRKSKWQRMRKRLITQLQKFGRAQSKLSQKTYPEFARSAKSMAHAFSLAYSVGLGGLANDIDEYSRAKSAKDEEKQNLVQAAVLMEQLNQVGLIGN